MEDRSKIYDDLKRDLREFPMEDFVREFAKAYFEGDMETIRKLTGLLAGEPTDASPGQDLPEPDAPDTPIGAPKKPRPYLNSGAVALPKPE